MDSRTHPTTPHSNSSRPSEARKNPAITPGTTTRIPLAATSAQSAPHPPTASQESNASVLSNESGPIVQPHSSRSSIVSSQYTSNTDLTSPSSSVESVAVYEGALDGAHKSQYTRARTPERAISDSPSAEDDITLFSPMSIASPAAVNGAKRTASGHVKNAPSLPSTPLAPAFGRQSNHRSRQASISSTGSRASELAANLKTRLGYAMAKVQHGWEHKTLTEVEQLATNRFSPNRFSPSILDGRRSYPGQHYGSANQDPYGRDLVADHASSPPSKRHSANYTSYLRSLHQTVPASGHAPQLQPAVDFRPASSHRQAHRSANRNFSHAMSPPRTPVNDPPHRPPTLRSRTQTAEDEREALQALFQLGSPHGSQFPHSYANSLAASNQTSPLRSEFATPRKFEFAHVGDSDAARSGESDGRPGPPRPDDVRDC